MKKIDLPESLRKGRLEYKPFVREPLVFGWVLTLNWELTAEEAIWLQEHGFVRVHRSWYKKDE